MIIRLFLLLLFSVNAYATGIHVSLNHNPVNLSDSFDIIFTANQEPDGEPDFSPLENDFSILSQSQRNSASWVNGKTSSTKQWVITVIAKQAGSLIIPSIRFGNDVSETATVLITQDANSQQTDSNDELFLKTEVSTQTPYIQSQVLYKVRLYTRVSIAQAQLTEPELSDALVEKIGEDSNYSTQINGVDYSVTERNYAIFPQKSGQLMIKPLSLTAEVVSGGGRSFNGFFFNSQATQAKRIQSKEIVLDVKSAPANFKGAWLTAEQLDLKQQWSADSKQVKVGEPVTRTLSLLAKGTTVGSLPELNKGVMAEGLKAYLDQPVLKENKPVDGVIAFREEKIALIPSKAGDYTLPAIEIPWFNTKTGQVEIAKIPATTLTAIGGAVTAPSAVTPNVTPAPVKTSEVAPSKTQLNPAPENSIWMWLAVFFGVAWLITLAYVLRERFFKKPQIIEPSAKELSLKACVQQLKRACQADDAKAANAALLAWGKQEFAVSSLTALAQVCELRLRDEILLLNAALYSKEGQYWQGKRLLQAFNEHKAKGKLKTLKQDGLEPLYRL
ncbi:MAG: BatD family protein [Methylococcaceae bacterium]